MGLFKDLRNLRKITAGAKDLRQQAEASGVDTSIGGLLQQTPAILEELGGALEQAQAGKEEGDRLRAEGRPASAKLIAVRDTGMTVGGSAFDAPGQENPVAELQLEVTLDGGAPYTTTTQQMIPRLAVGRLIPGSTLPLRVDPEDRERVIVDWEAPIA